MKQVPFYDLTVTGGFWAERQKTVRTVTARAVYDRFKETGRIDTMDGRSHGFTPHIFWGSDVAKWIEGIAYLLEERPEPALQALVEPIIEAMEQAVQPDGYYNSYFCNPEMNEPRFTDRNAHELYSLGHLIEAAVAWRHATGDERLMTIARRGADLVDRVFRGEHSAGFSTPGHEEIELALMRLWRATGEVKYRDLAEYFVRTRGSDPAEQAAYEKDHGEYAQSHLPVPAQRTAVGHAVRAVYLYSAVADLAEALGDAELWQAAEALFTDIYTRKMYITGGIGSQAEGECFTMPYHLPNRTAYAETCAALGLALFGRRMYAAKPDGRYGDAVERALFNGMISGLSLAGDAFFYENPLEMDLSRRVFPRKHVTPMERPKVFSCSCCPPNLVRLIPSIADFVYTYDAQTLFVHQYIPTAGQADGAAVSLETDYPASGKVHACYAGGKRLALRKPAWCAQFTASAPCREENGYLYFECSDVTVDFAMEPVFYTAASAVHENAGRVALMRGPIVYCIEGKDQPASPFRCRVNAEAPVTVTGESYGGLPILAAEGTVMPEQAALYAPRRAEASTPCTLRFIPYNTFANRGADDMQVWILTE